MNRLPNWLRRIWRHRPVLLTADRLAQRLDGEYTDGYLSAVAREREKAGTEVVSGMPDTLPERHACRETSTGILLVAV